MTFTQKIVHANGRDEIWVQTKTNNTLNTESNDPVTAQAVVEYVEDKMGGAQTYTAPTVFTFSNDSLEYADGGNRVGVKGNVVNGELDCLLADSLNSWTLLTPNPRPLVVSLNGKIPRQYITTYFTLAIGGEQTKTYEAGTFLGMIGDLSTIEEEELG
jgi:hypothetical protein